MQFLNSTACRALPLVLGCLSMWCELQAQDNSPYSRYALGNLKSSESVVSRGMGGVCIADDNAYAANESNPASYASLKLTSYQVGLEGSSVNLKNSSASNRTGGVTLSYVCLGFPINKHVGISFGLIPVTRSKFEMEQSTTIPNISVVDYHYYGGGGTQKIYLGGAYKYKDYSIGFNTGYLFGNVVNSSDAEYPDSLKIISSSITNRVVVTGLFFEAGAQMHKALNEKYHLHLGASYALGQNAHARTDTYWKSFRGIVSSPTYQYGVDSITSYRGHVYIPSKLSLGTMLTIGEVWKIGIDWVQSDWSRYRSYQIADSTTAYHMLKAGVSYTPDATSMTQTWKKVTYRAGLYMGQDIFRFNGTNLPVKGITVGLGYPIRRTNLSIGQLNACFDIGRRGTTSAGLLREDYTRFAIGFVLNDKWFLPRKYD